VPVLRRPFVTHRPSPVAFIQHSLDIFKPDKEIHCRCCDAFTNILWCCGSVDSWSTRCESHAVQSLYAPSFFYLRQHLHLHHTSRKAQPPPLPSLPTAFFHINSVTVTVTDPKHSLTRIFTTSSLRPPRTSSSTPSLAAEPRLLVWPPRSEYSPRVLLRSAPLRAARL
jgi:hypothetical protein